jgi:NAD(P)H-dependent FMN reductase
MVRNSEPGRFGTLAGAWFAGVVEQRDDFKLDLVDLARTPLTDLPRRIDEADAVVIVCPEYNHGYPGDLKTAIDAVRRPWYAKPVAFVVYGYRSGGLRAAEQLRQVFGELHAVTTRDTLSFHQPTDHFTADGEPLDPSASPAAAALLNQLAWWARPLREARTATPYPG